MTPQVRIGYALFGLLLAVVGGGCCETAAVINAVRGDLPPNSSKSGGGFDVFVCPGESVTLGWIVSDDVKTATVSGIGLVPTPNGSRTVVAERDTTYTLTAVGECETSSSCEVHVVQDGDKALITGQLVLFGHPDNPKQYYWEADLAEAIWSPSIVATSVAIVAFLDRDFWSAIPSIRVLKRDTDGTINDFPVTYVPTTPWPAPLPVVGNWKMHPVITSAMLPPNPPPFATLELTMRCR